MSNQHSQSQLFPDMLLDEVRSHLPTGQHALTYLLEMTPHRTERMIVLQKGIGPVVVCQWKEGRQKDSSITVTAAMRRAVSGNPMLSGLFPEILFAKPVGVRYVVARLWQEGVPLNTRLTETRNKASVLSSAVEALLSFQEHLQTPRPFDREDYSTLVVRQSRLLRTLTGWDGPDTDGLETLVQKLETLVGQEMPFGLVHGDFEFGNLLQRADGSLLILDWDLAIPDGPSPVDLFHLLIAYGVNAFGMTYAESVRALFLQDGAFYGLAQQHLDLYCRTISSSSDLGAPLCALTILRDAAQYLRRLPFLMHSTVWADYIQAAIEILGHD